MQDQAVTEILAFTLGNDHYGINILNVQEIRGYENVTRIANAPNFIKGVVNLRGIIVPVVDMRIRFGNLHPTYDQTTVVIILNINQRVIGMVVDGVSDVIALDAGKINEPPVMGSLLDVDFLSGIATVDERTLMLLNIEKLMTSVSLLVTDKAAA